MGNTVVPEQSNLDLLYICSDIPVPIFSEVLYFLPTILNINLLVRLNSYLCDRKSKNIHTMTTGKDIKVK